MSSDNRRWKRHSRFVTDTKRWKRLRIEVLRRDDWKCVKCGARGKLEIDHIEPVRARPDLGYAMSNLQTLCKRCHSAKTRKECGHPELSPERKRWRELVADLRPKPNRAGKDDTCLIP